MLPARRHRNGAADALRGFIGRLQVHPELFHLHFQHAGGMADKEHRVPLPERHGIHLHLHHANLGEPVGHRAHIYLAAGGLAAIHAAPLAHPGSQIIAVPETAVEDGGQALLQSPAQRSGESAVRHGIGRLPVAGSRHLHIVCAAGPAFNLEHLYARLHEFVQKLHRTEVLGRHQVFVVHCNLVARLQVCKPISPAADLHAGTPVGTLPVGVQ